MASDSHAAVILVLAPGSGQLIRWCRSWRTHGCIRWILRDRTWLRHRPIGGAPHKRGRIRTPMPGS